MKRLIFASLIVLLWSCPSAAVIEQQSFPSIELEQRYKSLIEELRCLVCQNQNLADSDAPLAKDLRRKTAEMLKDGASDQQIRDYMRERYGDFVLYRPPFTLKTAVLWVGPVLFLLIVLIVLALRIRKRQTQSTQNQAANEAKRAKVRDLLQDAPKIDS